MRIAAGSKWLVVALAALLTACASGPRVVDSQVQSVVTAGANVRALAPGARYRFERLPLDARQPGAERVELLASQALAAAGLVRDEARASLSVQASAYVSSQWVDDWGVPWPGVHGPGISNARMALYMGGRRGGFMFGGPLWWDAPHPRYQHEVHLLMRDVRSGQALYETRARHLGASGNSEVILGALFSAALQGFPAPPLGWRSVSVPLHPAAAPATLPMPAPAAATPVR